MDMKKYDVSINNVHFDVNASNRATAIRRAINGYYHDETICSESRKHRKKDTIGLRMDISIKRLE